MPTLYDVVAESEGENPFSDPEFNNCLVNDVPVDDLAEMVGLSIGNDDAGGGGGGGDGEDKDACLWEKIKRHIFNKNYREGTVAMGTNDPNEDYKAHVEGDFLTRSPVSGTEVWSDLVGRD